MSLTRGLARVVSIFGGLVANKSQDSAHNIAYDELAGACVNEFATDAGDVLEEGFDVMPF